MEIVAMVGTTFASSMFFVMGAFILLGQRISQLKCSQNMLRKIKKDEDEKEAKEDHAVHQLGDRLDLMDTGDRLDHIHDAVETIQGAIGDEEQKRTDQWTTFKQKIEQVSQSLIQLEQKNGSNGAAPAPTQSTGNPQSPPSSDMAGKWQLMLKDVREERASAERAWQQVVEERQRVKEQWATMEKITRECREALSQPLGATSGSSPQQAPAASPTSLAETDDKEFEKKMNDLQASEKAQLDAAIEELKIERKDVQDSLKQAREMHAEVSAMLKASPP